MATKYTLYFTDTNKTPFDLQSYTTNGPESPSDPSIIAGATSARTTLKLWGKGLPEYGEPIFQDLVYMLENFANSSAPVFPIEGQIWYDNSSSGSPSPLPKLKLYDGTTWPAIITANGSSAMTGELILSGDLLPSSDPNTATPKQYVDTQIASAAPAVHTHVTIDVTDITATFTEINSLVGIGSPVQTQFDNIQVQFGDVQTQFTDVDTELGNKVSRIVDTNMADTINLTFNLGGEILGLPAVPTALHAAASKQYVLNQITTAGGDGVLTSTEWLNTTTTPPNVFETTLRMTVTSIGAGGSPVLETTIDAEGISREGHTHQAIDIPIDNSFDVLYGNNVQSAIEYTATEIELIKTGGVPPSATINVERIFENLTSDIISPATWQTQSHFSDDNRLLITVNGVKQYTHSRASQTITYDINIDSISFTGLDSSTAYDFDISIDGGAAQTVTINAGSPQVNISTHGALVSAINDQLSAGSPPNALFGISGTSSEIFTTDSSGAGSTISITPTGSPSNIYLFDIDASPNTIIDATFLSSLPTIGSPVAVADDISIVGDVTASFPIGKTFTIRGSFDATYGSYDGVYSVYQTGPEFIGGNTVIPIAYVNDSDLNSPLLPLYNPNTGSPFPPLPNPGAGSPSSYGNVHLSPLGGLVQVETAVNGIEGDYSETDTNGDAIPTSSPTNNVVFNYDILTGSKIESLLYV